MNIDALRNKVNSQGYPSPLRMLVVIAVSIFATEFAIMIFFIYFPLDDIKETLIDASTLVTIITPILYYYFYRPFLHYTGDLKSAEDELLQFATAIDQGMEITLLTDNAGKIVYINPAGLAVTRGTWDKTVGRSAEDIMVGRGENDLYAKLASAVATGAGWEGEFGHQNEDGRPFHGYCRISGVKDGTGANRNYLFVGQDITAEKQAMMERDTREAELRDSEKRWRMLVDMAPDPIIVHDGKKIIYANKAVADMMGTKEIADIVGQSLARFVLPVSMQNVEARIKAMLETGQPQPAIEHKVKKINGETIDIDATASPIVYDGKPAFQIFMRDITKRKIEEAELKSALETAEDATKLKDKFVSLVSHDLREPLTAILGFSSLIKTQEGESFSPTTLSYLDNIQYAGKRIGTIAEDLLGTAMIRKGRINPKLQFINAQSVVSDAISTLDFKAKNKGVTLINNVPSHLRLRADKTLLTQVVQNLLGNAVKFSKKGSAITIYSPEARISTLAVADNGVGIPSNIVPGLFKYDVKTTTLDTDGEVGTGLGLPFAYEIMSAHKGDLTVETSENGSTFFATMPDVKPFVLLVEDHQSMTRLVSYFLGTMRVEVRTAPNGAEAMDIIAEKVPDLIITDLNMPVMNGFDLIRKLKGSEATAQVPVLVLTNAGKDEREAVMQMGAYDFISKFSVESDLVLRVRRIIN